MVTVLLLEKMYDEPIDNYTTLWIVNKGYLIIRFILDWY